MILGVTSPFVTLVVSQGIAKDGSARCLGLPFRLLIQAPITLKVRDELLVDVRGGTVEQVRRGGILLWHRYIAN